MLMKWTMFAVAVGLSAASHASYEMMLVLDGANQIHRYDAENRVYLGAIPVNGNTSYGLASRGNEVATVVQTGTGFAVQRYNIHSGRPLGSFALPTGFVPGINDDCISYDRAGNLLVSGQDFNNQVGGGRGTFRFSLSGVQSGTTIRWSATDFNHIYAQEMPNGNFYVVANSTTNTWPNRIMGFTPTNTLIGNYVFGTHAFQGSGYLMTASGTDNRLVLTEYVSGAQKLYFFRQTAGNPTLVNSLTLGSELTSGIYESRAVMGHGDYGYLISDPTINGSLTFTYTRVDLATMTYNANFRTPLTQVQGFIRASSIVLAPEPGTMIALGLGLAALIRAKKR